MQKCKVREADGTPNWPACGRPATIPMYDEANDRFVYFCEDHIAVAFNILDALSSSGR